MPLLVTKYLRANASPTDYENVSEYLISVRRGNIYLQMSYSCLFELVRLFV